LLIAFWGTKSLAANSPSITEGSPEPQESNNVSVPGRPRSFSDTVCELGNQLNAKGSRKTNLNIVSRLFENRTKCPQYGSGSKVEDKSDETESDSLVDSSSIESTAESREYLDENSDK